MINTKFIITAIILVFSQITTAAELKATPIYSKDGTQTGRRFTLLGEINRGDAGKFATSILNNRDWIDSVDLNSPGGNVQEAMIIGELIRAARLDTIVQPGQTCASACFIIWINGANRAAFPDVPFKNFKTGQNTFSRLGLHRPYLTTINNDERSLSIQTKVMQSVDSYLSVRRVPRRLIDEMMGRASNDIYWATQEDIKEIGESPPDLEELYVAKCGDNRKKLYSQINVARANSNSELESLLNDSVYKINSCINMLNEDARRRAIGDKFKSVFRSGSL
jgi:hypothetical protein